ncbi:MAG: extracellular solute-binding protein [Thermoleophilaceae bacterium]|nr:extracellular solute-binding protein [Thermoleophilaceae bacterium]
MTKPNDAFRRDSLGGRLTRRKVIERGAIGAAGLFGAGFLAACGGSSKSSAVTSGSKSAGGSITIGSFQDNAMAPFRDTFIKRFEKETGIKVKYNETSYDAWYQNAKNDGLNKTGAYDIYVMDDNWVPEFAASNIIQNLDEIGFKVNPDILPKGLEQGYWPPKSGPRLKDFANDDPALYAIVIIDDVELLYYHADYFDEAPKTWDDVYSAMKSKAKPPKLYGWSARGVKGNPIVMTYLPLLNSYGGEFVREDWSPGFAGPEGVGALERLMSFIPYMPAGVAEFDTDQETQVLLQGKCMALTEYTGLVHRVDDRKSSQVVGKIKMAATPTQEKSGPAIGTFVCGIASGAQNPEGAKRFLEWFTSSEIQRDFARGDGSAAVTKSALTDPQAVKDFRWLPAIADAVNNSVPKPKTPDEPKFEDILGTHLNQALVEAIQKKSGYTAIAKSHLTKAANEIAQFIKQQGGYV